MKGLKLWEVLKAFDEKKEVEYYSNKLKKWNKATNFEVKVLDNDIKKGIEFRIKPEVEVREYFGDKESFEFCEIFDKSHDTHKITIEFEDGEPICESIRMTKL
jgi:hypothetical protein